MTFCIVVRGPLASGKTTVANALAQVLDARVVSVDRILDEQGLEDWEDHDDGTYCITEESFLRANTFVIAEVRHIAATGHPAVVDGNFYWRSALDDLASRHEGTCRVFTLKVPLATCVERNKGREQPIGDEKDVKMVFDMVTSFDAGTSVDASGTAQEAVSRIVSDLRVTGAVPR